MTALVSVNDAGIQIITDIQINHRESEIQRQMEIVM